MFEYQRSMARSAASPPLATAGRSTPGCVLESNGPSRCGFRKQRGIAVVLYWSIKPKNVIESNAGCVPGPKYQMLPTVAAQLPQIGHEFHNRSMKDLLQAGAWRPEPWRFDSLHCPAAKTCRFSASKLPEAVH